MWSKINRACERILPDWLIDGSLSVTFSKPSVILHTVWFLFWFGAHMDVALLTNIVSLEAIYIGLLIGIQQINHHEKVMEGK